MILTQQNDRLYDSRNFDSYPNFYAICVNDVKIDNNQQQLKNEYAKCHVTYRTEIIYLLFNKPQHISEKFKNGYSILYGHFYNKQDYFLYKNVKNGKIIGCKVQKIKKDQLYYNTNKQIIASNSYIELSKQLAVLQQKLYRDQSNNLPTLTFDYEYIDDEDKIVFRMAETYNKYIDETMYANECLIVDFSDNNCVISLDHKI